VIKNFKLQTKEYLGFSTDYSDQVSVKIIQRLKNRKDLSWLKETTIDDEIRLYFKAQKTPLIWGIPPKIRRTVSQKISSFILKKCAKEHGLSLINIKPNDNNAFIVHDYMNPWIFLEKHIHQAECKKSNCIWHSAEHQQWKDQFINQDQLIINMTEEFEISQSHLLERGLIQRISVKELPVKSILYRLIQ